MRSTIVPILACLAGCGGASASGSASISIHDDLQAAPTALQACATGDIAAQMQLVADLRDSYHEMIVCGGLSLQFNNSITSVIANALLQKAMGTPLQYQGNGVYATSNGMMWIRVSTATAAALDFNVLDPQSYLAGLTVTVNANGMINGAAGGGGGAWGMLGRAAAKADVQVSFQGEGPGFQLLGITPQEARSGRLDQYLKKIEHSLASMIKVENRVSVNNHQGGTTINYILQSPPTAIVDMGKQTVPMQLASIQATTEIGQKITITKWTMDYKGDGGRVLDGTIGMDIGGGSFPYHVEMTYSHRAEPDITLTCGNVGTPVPMQ